MTSHPQALAQCDRYIRDWGVKAEASYDTAGSAKTIKENGTRSCAAICSSIAAKIYDMQILESNIEDDSNNFTRFLLLSKVPVKPSIDIPSKTSIVFSMKNTNEPAALFKALSVFALRDLNLTKIESRPVKPDVLRDHIIRFRSFDEGAELDAGTAATGGATTSEDVVIAVNGGAEKKHFKPKFKYMFYMDFDASVLHETSVKALGHLDEIASFVRVLGSYPTDGVLIGPVVDDISSGAASKDSAATTPASPLPLANRPKIGIVGFGRFGQFLGQKFANYGSVFATSRGDYAAVAHAINVTFCKTVDEMLSNNLDILIISTSILSFESIMEGLPKHKMRGMLVVDVLSVKVHAKAVMKKLLPADCDILCTHPMFGPDSGKYTWKNLPFVYESVRIIQKERCASFLDIFFAEGCKMVELSCEAHDAYAAGSQFITHFTGRMLGELKAESKLSSTPINTRGFETLLELVDNTCRDSFDLFYAIFKYNPNSSEQLTILNEAFGKVVTALKTFEKPKQNTLEINSRVNDIAPSQTVYLAAKVSELERGGQLVHSLAIGEPDFPPPDIVKNAVSVAMATGNTGYTNVASVFELRASICKYLKDFKSVTYTPDQILCTNGAKQAIFMSMLCLLRPRDEVIIPAPYWVSYPDIVRLVGGSPVTLDTYAEDNYLINPESLAVLITPRTRMIVLCNPSNPTGAVQPLATLQAIADILNRPENKHVFVLADEIYERIVFDESHTSFASLPGMFSRTITINGFSKAYGMTGFRLGYMAAPDNITNPCKKILSQTTHAPNTMAQHAGIAALTMPPTSIQEYVDVFRTKRDYVLGRLRGIPGVLVPKPEGAFYFLPTISAYLGKSTAAGVVVNDSIEFCMQLLNIYHVALTPGDAFGAVGTVRIAYATKMETLVAAMDGLAALCAEMK